MSAEIVEVGKDFRVFPRPLDHALNLVVLVGVMDGAALKNGELMAIGCCSFKVDRGRIEVQPLREQQVDLVDVLLQGRIARRIGRNIIRCA